MTWAPMPACTAITDIEWATTSWSSWARRRRSSATDAGGLLALGLGPLLGLGQPARSAAMRRDRTTWPASHAR